MRASDGENWSEDDPTIDEALRYEAMRKQWQVSNIISSLTICIIAIAVIFVNLPMTGNYNLIVCGFFSGAGFTCLLWALAG